MKNSTQGIPWRNAKVLIATVLAMTLAGVGNSALGTEENNADRSTFVSGNSVYSDCGLDGSDYALAMTGNLEGCLSAFVKGFKCTELQDYDLYFERGREVFVGKLNGKSGRFTTTYTFDGAYAKGFCQTFDPSLEVGGGCAHKIFGKTGAFKDAEGLIKFIDVIANVTGDPLTGDFTAGTGGNNFLYSGRIHFDHDD